ncbi:MAG: HD domain-containing protein [Leptospiraceae bacterium]|nr:HD domain-containing protein [Leptospiraceae bacterium]
MKTEFNIILNQFNIPELDKSILYERVIECYSESNRDYHNLRHIREMLENLNKYAEHIIDYPLLYISCLYHDIVYDTHASDNEEKSAEYLERDFGSYLSNEKLEICKKLILGTKKHEHLEDDFDNKIFLDSDLLILGRDRNRYIEYMDSIRKEYEWVEKEFYKQERTKILKKFLERDRIYFTDEIFKQYENRARENIKFEIEMNFQK